MNIRAFSLCGTAALLDCLASLETWDSIGPCGRYRFRQCERCQDSRAQPQEGWIVATLDADFHALLALSGATVPSVIRVRIEGLRAESMAKPLSSVLEVCAQDLNQGAVVSITESGIRVRHLPLLR